jgi:hypothetical protein
MTTTEQLDVCLTESLQVYEEIREMLKEWETLQGAEQARAEYERQTSMFDKELTELEQQKSTLEANKRRLQMEEEGGTRPFRPPIMPTRLRPVLPPPVAPQQRTQPRNTNQNAIQEARRQLKKLVGRWGRAWRLSYDVRGSINSIADDLHRPLGEALIMLDWDAFKNRTGSSESETEHLERLKGWSAALVEYREHLRGETDMLRTKYRRVLPLLDLWLGRQTEEGQKRWEQRVAETCAVKQEEINRLKGDISKLTQEIDEIKSRFRRPSGQPI